jgi:LysR family transcriptional regulator, regulator for bpeEF and oprC
VRFDEAHSRDRQNSNKEDESSFLISAQEIIWLKLGSENGVDQLLAMRVFARVVETGGFSKAAESLNMPKPSVTKLVQGLEAHLQVRLLNRTTRRVALTSDGAAYYERSARLLAELDEIEASIGHARVNPRGRVRVDVSSTLADMILLPSLPGFLAQYPEMQVELSISDRISDLVGDNVDCAIRGGELNDSTLVARRIAELHWVTCASPAYLQRHGEPATPDDLSRGHFGVGYLLAHNGRLAPLELARGDERIELRLPYRVLVNDAQAAVVAACAGLGIVQTPRFTAQPHIDAGTLRPILERWTGSALPFHVVYPQNRHLSARLRVFVEWIAELFAQHPYTQAR